MEGRTPDRKRDLLVQGGPKIRAKIFIVNVTGRYIH
jgi:hypothetical protein